MILISIGKVEFKSFKYETDSESSLDQLLLWWENVRRDES